MSLTLTPDQEAALDRATKRAGLSSRQDALERALVLLEREGADSEESARARELHARYPTLADLMADSPLVGVDIEFPRDQSPFRDVDFG
jgi:hypothetical protein